MKILHVVRRYGPVGGMERYVWEVTRELAALGHEVEVICERCHVEKPPGIAVHEIGEIRPRPRWLSLLRFGRRVERWLRNNPRPGFLIHSNERLAVHDVTTFHGPPFATVYDMPWWRRLSLRVAMQLYLEWRELASARCIVPNSTVISRMLAHYYPSQRAKLTEPVVPGVAVVQCRPQRAVPPAGGVVAFVGKEWRRKGLPLAVAVVAQLRRKRPALELWVIGPESKEIEHLFAGWQDGYCLLGWREDAAYWPEVDVLLHPAKAEPYGMVISEAMAAQVPVVVSDACGAAAQIGPEAGAVLSLTESVDAWIFAVEAQLNRMRSPPAYARSWREVSREYETIYRRCFDGE